eukprot:CAMPEP_0172358980 /NCGR_PEP_ID=MMETSP1060-20121228/3229_1 /TAXON_ID=37318 /ORGANISM="Pseudo-nitzschia pungens, Strain cf. cingulata" /LENGTH=593 /DNA_ID=CAMNT_0013080425 /DNA_START=189 /DNA_END=1971 /DNA_ORIENTATION=+
MMEFDNAAARLAREQSKMRGRRKGGMAISAKAAKQAEYQKKQQARLRAERERKKKNEAYRNQYLHDCQRQLRERSLAVGSSVTSTSSLTSSSASSSSLTSSSSSSSTSLLLTPTSIHGNGDKIALPPSVLETLTSQAVSSSITQGGNPWTFRIGVLNPGYAFPASPLFRALEAPTEHDDDDDDDDMSDDDGMSDEKKQTYLDELNHKYLAYTHCTVVEFTQEEGHVGIPRHIAEALLDPNNQHGTDTQTAKIPTTTTVDPAAPLKRNNDGDDDDDDDGGDDDAMQIDHIDDGSEQTPGHLAWGAFEIPDAKLEITMVQLPKGKGCTLVPTEDAVRNNFYGLKDVKLVLEQSLIRTRATLSRGDKVSTWHRGKKYLLDVAKVVPSSFEGVTCINTDIEVDFGEANASTTKTTTNTTTTTTTTNTTTVETPGAPPQPSNTATKTTTTASTTTTNTTGGFRLGTARSAAAASAAATQDQRVGASRSAPEPVSELSLPAEPPEGQKKGVCVAQIRYSGGRGTRRFAIETATVKDLFAFAASLMHGRDAQTFRLVTRFPRREFCLAAVHSENDLTHDTTTLEQAGIQQGQEMFMVEDL